MSSKTKNILATAIQVIVIVLIVSLIVAGISACGAFFEVRDGYEDANLRFNLGRIVSDSTGKGVVEEDDTMLYTNDALVCTGLRVKPNFSTRCNVEVHFFTEDNRYIGYKTFGENDYLDIKVGQMPCLKDVKDTDGDGVVDYNLDNSEYAEASFVKNGDKYIQAHHVRFVINPLDNEKDIFTGGWFGLYGLANRSRFANGLDVDYTDALVTENAVAGPSVSI